MEDTIATRPQHRQVPSATLGNVSGHDLAKEVRAILLNQRAAAENQAAESQQQQAAPPVVDSSAVNFATTASTLATVSSCDSTLVTSPTVSTSSGAPSAFATTAGLQTVAVAPASIPPGRTQAFSGIEEAAKYSRTKQKVLTAASQKNSFSSDDENSSRHADNIDGTKRDNVTNIQMMDSDDGGGDSSPESASPS